MTESDLGIIIVIIETLTIILGMCNIYKINMQKPLNQTDKTLVFVQKSMLVAAFVCLINGLCKIVEYDKKDVRTILDTIIIGIFIFVAGYLVFKAIKKYFCVEKISKLEKENRELRKAIENKGEKY